MNIFIGLLNYGDGCGCYFWDYKYGILLGDKLYKVKVYGYYIVLWDVNIGVYFVF